LQRQKKRREDSEAEEEINETLVSRPYLSEAWDVLDLKKSGVPIDELINSSFR